MNFDELYRGCKHKALESKGLKLNPCCHLAIETRNQINVEFCYSKSRCPSGSGLRFILIEIDQMKIPPTETVDFTHIFLLVPVRLEHLEDDELGEGLEAVDQPILLQHLRQHAEHERAGRPHLVAQVLDQQPQDVPERHNVSSFPIKH